MNVIVFGSFADRLTEVSLVSPSLCSQISILPVWLNHKNFLTKKNLICWQFTYSQHNHHFWSVENPHQIEECRLQTRFGFNVWCGILGRHLIGPFIFNETLNGERCLILLRERTALHQIVPEDAQFQRLWFQQDGCPAHNTMAIRTILSEQFGDNIISNNGPVAWPARSPDITPLDFYLWGHIKNEVYEFDPPVNRNILEDRVRDSFTSVNRNTLSRVIARVLKNCFKCRSVNGRHFSHLNDA